MKKRTYSEMKDSGIEWIGEIPKEWGIKRLKHVSSIIMGQSPNGDDIVGHGTYPFMQGCSEFGTLYPRAVTFCNEPSKTSRIGDILMSIRAPVGKVNISDRKYGIGRGLCAIKAEKIDCNFLWYFILKSENDFYFYSNGSTFYAITTFDLLNFNITYPPLSEQTAIANYLDAKCTEIDSIISEAKSCIEEYKNWKSAIIFEAVTKGLDPNAEMKDSGLEWIGEIPSEWGVIKIKNIAFLKGRIGWQGLESKEYQEEGAFLITGTDFEDGTINWDNCVHISEQRYYEDKLLHIRNNDLLITKDGTIGKLAIVKNCPEQVTLNSGVMYIRENSAYKYLTKYLYYVLMSGEFWEWYNASQRGNSTIKHLYQEQFYDFIFGYPPLSEQTAIANYLDSKCAQIEEVISEKEALISDLESYKKSLIYEVVTGKIKVS